MENAEFQQLLALTEDSKLVPQAPEGSYDDQAKGDGPDCSQAQEGDGDNAIICRAQALAQHRVSLDMVLLSPPAERDIFYLFEAPTNLDIGTAELFLFLEDMRLQTLAGDSL